VKRARPVFLDLTKIALPVTAIISIFHRISGIIMFLAVPLLIAAFDYSLTSTSNFTQLQVWFASPVGKFLIWGVVSLFIYHAIAGLRHLLHDMGLGESLAMGRMTAYATVVISLILIALLGIWLW